MVSVKILDRYQQPVRSRSALNRTQPWKTFHLP